MPLSGGALSLHRAGGRQQLALRNSRNLRVVKRDGLSVEPALWILVKKTAL
jgi:hypothetical protein